MDDRGGCTTTSIPSYGSAEEPVGLDQLEPLVREGRRVDRDLRAHPPGRVRQRLSTVTSSSSVARAPAERPAGRREHERRRVRVAALEALEQRRVLAVNGEQPASASLVGRDRQVAGGDEALLVRERERDPLLERPQGRADPGEPRSRSAPRPARPRSSSWTGRRRPGRARRGAWRRARRGARCRTAAHRARARVAFDDLDRLPPDRAGRTEQRNASHAVEHA